MVTFFYLIGDFWGAIGQSFVSNTLQMVWKYIKLTWKLKVNEVKI